MAARCTGRIQHWTGEWHKPDVSGTNCAPKKTTRTFAIDQTERAGAIDRPNKLGVVTGHYYAQLVSSIKCTSTLGSVQQLFNHISGGTKQSVLEQLIEKKMRRSSRTLLRHTLFLHQVHQHALFRTTRQCPGDKTERAGAIDRIKMRRSNSTLLRRTLFLHQVHQHALFRTT